MARLINNILILVCAGLAGAIIGQIGLTVIQNPAVSALVFLPAAFIVGRIFAYLVIRKGWWL